MREQLDLPTFLKVAQEIVRAGSTDRDSASVNCKMFSITIPISSIEKKAWQKAYEWSGEKRRIFFQPENNPDFFFRFIF